MGKHFRRWGAVYLMFGLFLGSWFGQLIAQYCGLSQEAEQHNETFQWSQFWAPFFSATLENWQSEWLQLFVQGAVLLGMKHLIFKADAEDTEVIEGKIDRLLEKQGLDPQRIRREIRSKE